MNRKAVVIHQPDFAPYLGFFHRFLNADMYIALDHVQFVNGTSRAWTHRDKIKTEQGEKWLTVGVKKAPRDTAINDIELSTTADWRRDNLRLLEQHYRNAPFFAEMMPEINRLYAQPFRMLRDFNMASIEMLMDLLDVRIPWVWSSGLDPVGTKNELLVDLLRKVSATHYCSGVGARDYFDPAPFREAGIEVVWQKFTPPAYPQLYGKFVPYLSSIDLLFNCGVEKSREILKGCQ
ncbi:MAG: WbqC family protein [Nitrospinae bacterium]|nr:WbqC family protein [Nitrospinota bacterium]